MGKNNEGPITRSVYISESDLETFKSAEKMASILGYNMNTVFLEGLKEWIHNNYKKYLNGIINTNALMMAEIRKENELLHFKSFQSNRNKERLSINMMNLEKLMSEINWARKEINKSEMTNQARLDNALREVIRSLALNVPEYLDSIMCDNSNEKFDENLKSQRQTNDESSNPRSDETD